MGSMELLTEVPPSVFPLTLRLQAVATLRTGAQPATWIPTWSLPRSTQPQLLSDCRYSIDRRRTFHYHLCFLKVCTPRSSTCPAQWSLGRDGLLISVFSCLVMPYCVW